VPKILRVLGLGSSCVGIWVQGCKVKGLGSGLGLMNSGKGLRVKGLGFRVKVRVYGSEFRV
jgi:hypothetical protein